MIKKTAFALSCLALSMMGTSVLANDEQKYHFNDADQFPWATPSIDRLYNEGLVKGIGDNQFAPNRPMTRAEFAVLVENSMPKKEAELLPLTFLDVTKDQWYYDSVHRMYSMGMIKGLNPYQFEPNQPITREEAAVIIYRAFDYSHKSVDLKNLPYKDQDKINPWAKTSILALTAQGILKGTGENFEPHKPLTRAEGAVLLHRVKFGEAVPFNDAKVKVAKAKEPPAIEKFKNTAKLFNEKLHAAITPLLGTPYKWGGQTVKGFDCSGFTQYVYKKMGYDLPRVVRDQAKIGKKVSRSKMMPGDLIFFDTGLGYVSHVGIYIGDNQMVHAASGTIRSKGGIKISNIDWYFNNYKVTAIKRVADFSN